MKLFLVYPHHLFESTSALEQADEVWLIEEPLFFTQYAFHKQKLILHRASMRYYQSFLQEKGFEVNYVSFQAAERLESRIQENGVEQLLHYDVCDDWLHQKIVGLANEISIEREECTGDLFLLSREEVQDSLEPPYLMARFYREQRKRFGILVDPDGKPQGGKWSFDAENRKKLPKDHVCPRIRTFGQNQWVNEAKEYVMEHFPDNPGAIEAFAYPVTHEESQQAFQDFLENRFRLFGDFEDAIEPNQEHLYHAVLTPYLNIGLITPKQVLDGALQAANSQDIPLNSLEGFIRQVLGWREFMRGMYVKEGRKLRSRNFYGFEEQIEDNLYQGNTGVQPVDEVIQKIQRTAYAHHIERLMVLGNWMLLQEKDPHEVYRWFMELFIDAYDWVMVPNVYAMSQYADGGSMTTKPYISSSNYIKKMSPYGKAKWNDAWDKAYWRHMILHYDKYKGNPRMSMMLNLVDKMSDEKREWALSD